MSTRRVALEIVLQILLQGRSLHAALELNNCVQEHRAFVQEISFGVCRWYHQLSALIDKLLDKPLKNKHQDIYCLLLIGAYQLCHMHLPAYAAVHDTVAVADEIHKPWAKALTNAVLRKLEAQRDVLIASLKQAPAEYAHPSWLINLLQREYPSAWQDICHAGNCHPPMVLRVNRMRCSRQDYLRALQDTNLRAQAHPLAQHAIVLETPVDVSCLPHFAEGWVSVQDAAAQLAAGFLDCHAGMRVLDACAAPGGKSTHILEYVDAQVELHAVDIDAERLQLVKDSLTRLHQAAHLHVADATRIGDWWNGGPFHRILIDAPCSATGVIRRHPDIKLLRRQSDINGYQCKQDALLNALWPVLAPGGVLLYVTCSVLQQENSERIETFVKAHADVREVELQLACAPNCQHGVQILPGTMDMDGLYFACLTKVDANTS